MLDNEDVMRKMLLIMMLAAMAGLGILFAAALSGCAPEVPYVTMTAIGSHDPTAWDKDGPEVAITVHNPTTKDINGRVTCSRSDGQWWFVHVPRRGDVTALGQVMTRDLHANPCRVEVLP